MTNMKYDFDKITPRRGTNSYKWDSTDDKEVLPMWVADMDFPTAPCIINALEKRVEHGIFGYTRVPEEYYDAVISWFSRRHHWKPRREWFIYTSGVVPALSAVIKALTNVGDKVLTLTPVYNCFFSSIRNNGCELDSCALRYEDNTFSIDYEDLERRAADPKTTLMLLCNPHNPSGRVWTREELRRIGDICIKNNVVVVADEIHCELLLDNQDRYSQDCTVCGNERKKNSQSLIKGWRNFLQNYLYHLHQGSNYQNKRNGLKILKAERLKYKHLHQIGYYRGKRQHESYSSTHSQ